MKKPLEIFSFGFIIIAMVLSSCGTAGGDVLQSRLARVGNPDAAPTEVEELVAGNTAFALDLYKDFRTAPDNLFYSPYSISLALAMTYAGARGQTAEQMASSLHFTLPQEKLHPAFNALDLALASRSTGAAGSDKNAQDFKLSIVNSLWGQKGWSFLQDYLDLLASNYGAGMRLVDYRSAAEQARQAINQWVAEQTQDKIKDLIAPGTLDPAATLVLVNAIYFKAGWEYPFSDSMTKKADFTLLDGSQVQAEMMSFDEANSLGYARGDNWQAAALPYQGGSSEMVVLLPDAGQFEEFEQGLDAGKLEQILAAIETKSVMVSMPKFGFTDEHLLRKSLSGLGMQLAFDDQQADFSGMDGKRDLVIDEVIHKAFVKVDEKGTEAAAATAVVMRATAMLLPEVELRVDRPFIFLIRDIPSGSILFIGRVLNPAD
jgi:serpin B